MGYPAFFDAVPRVRLRDPLADFLGAAEDGLIDYGYPDAVRLAGHSCPTVASAYWMTVLALDALYPDQVPERGGLRVQFRSPCEAGVTGVMASVVSMITGAAGEGGFKGLAGRFVRRDLLHYAADIPQEIRYTRLDGSGQVDVAADLRPIPADPELSPLMQRCLGGLASTEEQGRFGTLWQERVRRVLLDHGRDPAVFLVRRSDSWKRSDQ